MLSEARVSAYAPTKDLTKARRFYEDVLRMKIRQEGGPGVLYECGEGTTFFLYTSDGAGTNQASTLFWGVDDVHRVVRDLQSQGVEFENYDMPYAEKKDGVADFGSNQAAWFKDPDGNILAIISN